jgi:hypothetical protein
MFTPDFAGGSFATGSEALASLDSNGDGVIDSNDEAFANLSIWQDANADGVTDQGELSGLAAHGITSISTVTQAVDYSIDGQAIIGEGTFQRADGSSGSFVEVALDTSPAMEAPEAASGDTFFIDPSMLSGIGVVELIADFAPGQDMLDLSDLMASLGENQPATAEAADAAVNLTFEGGNTHVMVDTDGAGAGNTFVEVATITGVNQMVSILYDDNKPAHDVA